MFDQNELNQLRGVVQEVIVGPQMRGVVQSVIESQQIRGVVKEIVVESVGEALEEIVLPRFEQIDQRFEQIDHRFEQIDQRFDRIEGRLGKMESAMVTRDFLEERLVDFRVSLTDSADWVGRQLKRLTHTMHQGGLLTPDQLIEIHAK